MGPSLKLILLGRSLLPLALLHWYETVLGTKDIESYHQTVRGWTKKEGSYRGKEGGKRKEQVGYQQ